MRRVFGFVLLLVLLAAGALLRGHDDGKPIATPAQSARPKPAAAPAAVDNAPATYILAMSWSPAWCAEEDPSGRTDQCATGANSGLVVHGLWPANRDDGEFCRSNEPDRLPDDLARRVRGFMPSVGLARHEWQKHGACTGLSQRHYFAAMEKAWTSFRSPALLIGLRSSREVRSAELRQAIVEANPASSPQALGIQCDRDGHFSEIRLCLTGGLLPAACPRDTGRGCPNTLTILPTR